ncbi:MAG TPA: VOC family protein [Candidatus Sulfomarinibacteraceae bacterium]|nr:VOC family protein [Candidatus Sulfomarinibacteraceae bacterium]
MLLGLDHLVVAVPDPDAAAAELERTVGLACTGGGRHPLWGTFNRLAWLGDTYVELIGVSDRSLTPLGAVSRAVAAALEAGHAGLVTYAVASDDLDADLARLRAGGSDLGEIEARSRARPDGEVVRWRASFPPRLGPAEPPFVIEHELSGAEWGEAARAARASFVHPLGSGARITALELPVANIEAAAVAYSRTVGVQCSDIDPRSAHAAIGAQAVRLHHGAPLWNPAVVELTIEGADSSRDNAGIADIAAAREIDAVGVRWRILGY